MMRRLGKVVFHSEEGFQKPRLFCEEHGYLPLRFFPNVLFFVFQGELPIVFAKLGQSKEGHSKRG
jgi:hypothetical protein